MESSIMYENGDYLKRNPTWHTEASPWKARQVLKLIEKHGLQPMTVCEVGCGAGEVLNQLRDLLGGNVHFYGYEISPQAYELARQREKSRLHFYLEDLTQENARFDLLLVIDVFEHVEDYMGFLRQLRSKASYVLFHIPLDLSVNTVMRAHKIIYTRNMVGHLHHFTKETALATLQDTGYEVIDYRLTAGSLELGANTTLRSKVVSLVRRSVAMISTPLASKLMGGFSLLVLTKPTQGSTTRLAHTSDHGAP